MIDKPSCYTRYSKQKNKKMTNTPYMRGLQASIQELLGDRCRSGILSRFATMTGSELQHYSEQQTRRTTLGQRWRQGLSRAFECVSWWRTSRTFAFGASPTSVPCRQLLDPLSGSGLVSGLLELALRNSSVREYVASSMNLRSELHVFDYYIALRICGEKPSVVQDLGRPIEWSAYDQLEDMAF